MTSPRDASSPETHFGFTNVPLNEKQHLVDDVSVSYTHLDVYKRQMWR